MANDIFSRWDDAMDVEGLQADIKEAEENGGTGSYKEVPHDTYEVELNKMEIKESKKGDPMLSIWFKIVSGEYKGSLIFYNQVITQGFQIHMANIMLRSLTSECEKMTIEFKSYKQYNDLVMDIFEDCADNFEYALKYTENKKNKNFSDFEILETYILE